MTSWGALVNQGLTNGVFTLDAFIPSGVFSHHTVCFNFIGDGLRDALDPKDRTRGND